MAHRLDGWIFSRIVSDLATNDDFQAVSARRKPLAAHLANLPALERQKAFQAACIALGADGERLFQSVLEAEPSGPTPEVDPGLAYATLADFARFASEQRWLWEGWLARGVFNAVAAEPGTGKTRFALDLARRMYSGLPWPDGQATGLPEGTRTLWIQADRAFLEMLECARAFGLPEEAVCLASSPDDPMGSLALDDPETLAALALRIQAAKPALVVIDTVGMTTGLNLCRTEDARAFFGPLMDLAAASGVAIVGLTHLSKDKEALGRRIVQKARVVIKITKPDPEGQPNRRKLWVDKTAAVNPPALGITMGDSGNEYDSRPPTEPEANKVGRTPDKREKAIAFIRQSLATRNDRVGKELEADWVAIGESDKTFWRGVNEMVEAEEVTTEGGTGTGRRKVLHLVESDSDSSP